MNRTSIEWTDLTVNPLRARHKPTGKIGHHCVKVGPGCRGCYAEAINLRGLPGNGTGLEYSPRANDEIEMFVDQQQLKKMRRRRKPARFFVCSMTDLFGEFVPSPMIQEILDDCAAAEAKGHTPQLLTKRAARMVIEVRAWVTRHGRPFPSGIWLGFSAENQALFDQRWTEASRLGQRTAWGVAYEGPIWASLEPLLGSIDLGLALELPGEAKRQEFGRMLDSAGGFWAGIERTAEGYRRTCKLGWAVIGGESGRKARGLRINWVRQMLAQLGTAGVPAFVKQLGRRPIVPAEESIEGWGGAVGGLVGKPHPEAQEKRIQLKHGKGGDPWEWAPDLRTRELPTAAMAAK